jgi:phage gpG-like protein
VPEPFRLPSSTGPLRPSDIKASIYGRGGRGGLRFDRILSAGWSLRPSIGLVAKDIFKLGLELESFREPLVKSIKVVMMPSIRKNFDRGGRPEPGWEPLAPYTIEVRGNAWPILVRTGALRRTASSFQVWSIGKTTATIKSLPDRVWYGNIHQAGYGSLMDVARKQLGGAASQEDLEAHALQLFLGAGKSRAKSETKFVIPQRQFILFQDQDIERIQEIFADWMEEKADKVGRGWHGR